MLTLRLVPAIICFVAPPVPSVQGAQNIVKIDVSGNLRLNSVGIVMASGLKIGAEVRQQDLDRARANLLSTGNFGAADLDRPEDSVKIETSDIIGGVSVTISVRENDVVTGMNITGSGPIRTSEILRLLETNLGSILNLNVLRADIHRVQQAYVRRGYRASVAGDEFAFEKGILHLPITVGKVGMVRFGILPEKLVNEVRKVLRIKPGDYFNLFALQEGLRRAARVCARHGYLLDLTPQPIAVDGPAYSVSYSGATLSWSSRKSAVLTLRIVRKPKSILNRSPVKRRTA